MLLQIYAACPKPPCNNKKLRQTEDGLACDFCKSHCSEVEAVRVAKAVGLLLINPDEICDVNLWHKELIQIANHVCERNVSVSTVEKAIDEMRQWNFPSNWSVLGQHLTVPRIWKKYLLCSEEWLIFENWYKCPFQIIVCRLYTNVTKSQFYDFLWLLLVTMLQIHYLKRTIKKNFWNQQKILQMLQKKSVVWFCFLLLLVIGTMFKIYYLMRIINKCF